MNPPSHRAVFRYHPRFGYFFRGHLHVWQLPREGLAPLHLIVTNSAGARCRHEPDPAGDTTSVRILFIGCSSAAGDNVSNRDRFTDILEQLIPRLVSHNYALSGSGHDQQLLVHQEFAPVIDPDVLVLCPSLTCIGRNLLANRLHHDAMTGGSILVPKPYFTLDDSGSLVPHQVPVPKPVLKTRPDARFSTARPAWGRRVKDAIKSLISRPQPAYLNSHYDDPQESGYRLGYALLRQILRESNASIKLVAPLPDLAYVTHASSANHHPFFRSLAAEAQAQFVDVVSFFQPLSQSERERSFFPVDGHYTRSGHEVIARGLAETLRASSDWAA